VRPAVAEDGFSSVEWALGLGLIILPLVIAVTSVAPVLDRLSTARTLAAETARTMVLADDWEAGEERAFGTARLVAANHGIDEDEWCDGTPLDGCVSVEITGTTPGVLERGGEVFVVVRIPTAAVTVPFIGEFASFMLRGSHTERVDDYRSFPAVSR
jgi:hypothetical protein